MAESSTLDRPHGMPMTITQTLVIMSLGILSSLFTLPLATLPTITPLALSGGVGETVLQVYFGMLIAVSIPGVSNVKDRLYEVNENDSGWNAVMENINLWMVMLSLMVLYMNVLFVGTLWATTALPAWAWYIALVVPLADRTLISSVGYSPAFLPVIAAAYALRWTKIVSDIDLDAVRQLNPAGLTQPQTPAA